MKVSLIIDSLEFQGVEFKLVCEQGSSPALTVSGKEALKLTLLALLSADVNSVKSLIPQEERGKFQAVTATFLSRLY